MFSDVAQGMGLVNSATCSLDAEVEDCTLDLSTAKFSATRLSPLRLKGTLANVQFQFLKLNLGHFLTGTWWNETRRNDNSR